MLEKIFESHAHYDDEAFDNDRENILISLHENSIEKIINVGASLASTKRTIQLMNHYDFIYGALGIHPNECGNLTEDDIVWIKKEASNKKCCAIGEIGLDYYWKEPDKDIQKHWFVRQLDLAKELNLPVIIHSRNAAKDTLDIMKAERADKLKGVIHCYSYSVEIAREYFNMGYYFGVGGVLTYPDAKKLKEVAKYLPLDCILLETDSPYLPPVPHRGERNNSGYLPYVIEELAKLKGTDTDTIIKVTKDNAYRLFSKVKKEVSYGRIGQSEKYN